MNERTWILVADAGRGWLYATDRQLTTAEMVVELENDDARAKGTELRRDDRGRTQPRNRNAARGAALAPTTPAKEVEAQKFARRLAEMLRLAQAQNRFDALIVAAPPAFLGLLRSGFAGPVSDSVVAEINKDYTHERLDDLLQRLRPLL